MTLADFKTKVYAMIEELDEDADDLTTDSDLASKFNTVTNQVMNEVSRFKKIPTYTTLEVEFAEDEDEYQIAFEDIDEMIYQIDIIKGVESQTIGKQIIFFEEGTAKIFYWKYPNEINTETTDEYEFELDREAVECMAYGVAADLLLPDVASQFGNHYAKRYQELLSRLDGRTAIGGIYIDGGVDV